jgi:large subunit ribosomal protein L33
MHPVQRAGDVDRAPFGGLVAKKKNVARTVIHLECTEQRESGVAGMSRYTTMKNKKNTPKRLELRKYNPYLRRYTLHREIK